MKFCPEPFRTIWTNVISNILAKSFPFGSAKIQMCCTIHYSRNPTYTWLPCVQQHLDSSQMVSYPSANLSPRCLTSLIILTGMSNKESAVVIMTTYSVGACWVNHNIGNISNLFSNCLANTSLLVHRHSNRQKQNIKPAFLIALNRIISKLAQSVSQARENFNH